MQPTYRAVNKNTTLTFRQSAILLLQIKKFTKKISSGFIGGCQWLSICSRHSEEILTVFFYFDRKTLQSLENALHILPASVDRLCVPGHAIHTSRRLSLTQQRGPRHGQLGIGLLPPPQDQQDHKQERHPGCDDQQGDGDGCQLTRLSGLPEEGLHAVSRRGAALRTEGIVRTLDRIHVRARAVVFLGADVAFLLPPLDLVIADTADPAHALLVTPVHTWPARCALCRGDLQRLLPKRTSPAPHTAWSVAECLLWARLTRGRILPRCVITWCTPFAHSGPSGVSVRARLTGPTHRTSCWICVEALCTGQAELLGC